MADTKRAAPRPLSPHLSIYRPQITSVLSITHRITGAGLAFGALFATWWLLSVASGIDTYTTFYGFAKSWLGRLMLFGFLWSVTYHMLNGVRHLVWDTGRGIDIPSATKSGWAVVGGSVVLAIFFWVLA
jgi:succinate dehydrogenase / fumarate reductase cytochrome b subunit